MAEATKTSWNHVWVKDRAGNEFVCALDALKDPKSFPESELENCIEDASRGIPIGD